MSKQTEHFHAERRETWEGQGVRLEIVATYRPGWFWSLSVINERGVMSIWHESFATADLAIEAARQAIEQEGIDDFVRIEDFEYLDEEPMTP